MPPRPPGRLRGARPVSLPQRPTLRPPRDHTVSGETWLPSAFTSGGERPQCPLPGMTQPPHTLGDCVWPVTQLRKWVSAASRPPGRRQMATRPRLCFLVKQVASRRVTGGCRQAAKAGRGLPGPQTAAEPQRGLRSAPRPALCATRLCAAERP